MRTLPKPAHRYGYTNDQIHEIFPTAEEYSAFGRWMNGQTGAIDDETGQLITYANDVERFIAGLPVID